MFRAAHSAPGWNETCEFVEVTTCPHPLGPEVIPIWASHATRDVDGCERGTAFVPIGVGSVEDDVPLAVAPEPAGHQCVAVGRLDEPARDHDYPDLVVRGVAAAVGDRGANEANCVVGARGKRAFLDARPHFQ